ncbi:tail protein X [Paenibacillus taichungensis]|uniref:tail protein X n=1 Tax=Paenibacillus taichungensis TaxID=484184 RepID=UPI003828B552
MIYRTIQGDTWDGIAFKLSGRYDVIPDLMYANLDYIQTVIFAAGVELVVPEIQPQAASTLPSWRVSDE